MKAVYETLSAENTDAQALIRELDVEFDGSATPIKALGTVSKKSQQIIKISLYDESVTEGIKIVPTLNVYSCALQQTNHIPSIWLNTGKSTERIVATNKTCAHLSQM